jgi:hypothetical protein
MHFIMAETDHNLMVPVRTGSLLAVWSGGMPNQEVESEYNVFFLILKMSDDFLTKVRVLYSIECPFWEARCGAVG